MKDKWMNLGCEEDELKPYVEPEQDFKEPKRIGMSNKCFKITISYLVIKIFYLSLLTSSIFNIYIYSIFLFVLF